MNRLTDIFKSATQVRNEAQEAANANMRAQMDAMNIAGSSVYNSAAASVLGSPYQNVYVGGGGGGGTAGSMDLRIRGGRKCGKGRVTVTLREIDNGYVLEHQEHAGDDPKLVFCKDLEDAGKQLIGVYARYQME
jgi:hypothetical protein